VAKVTVHTLQKMKQDGQRIAVLTAYDAAFARLLDQTGIDVLLVGDSLGMVVQGQPTTLSVTLEDIIYHCRAVARGASRAHLVGDMPFLSYQGSLDQAVVNCGRVLKEGGAEAIKLEGGARHADLVRRLTQIGIPVMGHVGLTPQSVHAMGGFRVQGRDEATARAILDDAVALEQAGAYSVVLESIPGELAQAITSRLRIPTIGIGAGPHCDGQVLVIYDLLGMDDSFRPRFLKRYENLALRIRTAVESYAKDVREGRFPGEEHTVHAKDPVANGTTDGTGGGDAPYGSVNRGTVGGFPCPPATEPAGRSPSGSNATNHGK
jgi:3-methyl-2-oxobutanoate hydroxymethyltransferase